MIDREFILWLRPHGPWSFQPVNAPEHARTFMTLDSAEAWAAEQSGDIQFLPFGPGRKVNLLDVQRQRRLKGGARQMDRSRRRFPRGRAREACRAARRDKWMEHRQALHARRPRARQGAWRGMGATLSVARSRPSSLFPSRPTDGGRRVRALSNCGGNGALIDYAAAHELIAYLPPSNPKASFWFPGSTFFVVLMPRYASPPKFLVDQLRYPKGDTTLADIVREGT